MPRPKTLTAEERKAMADQTAAETRATLEAKGEFVSPTRAGSVEPPLMDEDPDQKSLLEEAARIFEEDEEMPTAHPDDLFTTEPAKGGASGRGLHAKITEVILEVGYIQKTGTAPKAMGGYSFVEAGQIAAKLRVALASRGVTMLPEFIEQVGDILIQTTRNGGTLNIQTIKTTWRLTDSETGESTVIQSMGTGGDSGDKFSPKAQTNAMKYALQVGFLLETGDDPEKFDLSDAPATGDISITGSQIEGVRQGGRQTGATQVQLDQIRAKARELDLSPESLSVLIASALGGKAPDIDNLETSDAQRAVLEFLGGLTFAECGTVLAAIENVQSPKNTIRVRLDHPMAAWLEDLVADERWFLVKEMHEARGDGADDPTKLSEVRLAEKVLEYIRGSMREAGWDG